MSDPWENLARATEKLRTAIRESQADREVGKRRTAMRVVQGGGDPLAIPEPDSSLTPCEQLHRYRLSLERGFGTVATPLHVVGGGDEAA